MRVSIGIDVGWSARRRSCALAIKGPFSLGRARKFARDVSVGLYFIDELLEELKTLARDREVELRRAVLVIDGPVGPYLDAIVQRGVDGSFAQGGFYNRAPGYPITQGSGLELSKATARILHALEEEIPVKAWLGGALPTEGLAVAETNPTPAMALLVPQQDVATLPSRAHSKYIDGATIAAKSDWYWRLGAGSYAARVLGDPAVAAERNHERVAGLFTLALATALAGCAADNSSIAALGESSGIYVVPSDIDETWAADVQRVGVVHGIPHPIRASNAQPPPVTQTLDVAGASEDALFEKDNAVTVTLNDNGGLNTVANPWLIGIEVPRPLKGPNGIEFAVEGTFQGRDDMYRVAPSTLTLARRLGFQGDHLSKTTPVAFEAVII